MPRGAPSPRHWAHPLLLLRARPRRHPRDAAPCRDFATEYLTCDCNLRWVLPWARNRSAQISDRTLCVYPRHVHAVPLRGARESQLRCGERGPGARAGGTAGGRGGSPGRLCVPPNPPAAGTPELHTHHLIPSLRQVVFQGDRLPFQCTATYLDNSTQIRWYHNREPVEEDERTGVIVEESLIHDCTFITRSGRGGWG